MLTRRRYSILALLLLAPLLAGCLYSHELNTMRRAFEAEHPGTQFDQQIVLNLGPLSLRTAGWIAGAAVDEDPEVRPFLRFANEVYRVKVGVYETEGLAATGTLPRLRSLERDGWQTLVKVREEQEAVWVLYRSQEGCFFCDYYPRSPVRDLYVLSLSDEELVMVRLRGDFEAMLQRAFRLMGPRFEMTPEALARADSTGS